MALQTVPRSTCVSVQSSPYKILQGTLQNYEVRDFLKKSCHFSAFGALITFCKRAGIRLVLVPIFCMTFHFFFIFFPGQGMTRGRFGGGGPFGSGTARI